MRKLYLDANVYLDFWFDRTSGLEPLGYYAGRVFERAAACEFGIVVSDCLLLELYKTFYPKEVDATMAQLRAIGKLCPVANDRATDRGAHALSASRGVPLHDAVHAILAKKAGATLVTRDKHFLALADIVEARKPEEL